MMYKSSLRKRWRVKNSWIAAMALLAMAAGLIVRPARAQQAAVPTPTVGGGADTNQIPKTLEAYLRHLYAFGPDVEVHVSEARETPIAGLLVSDVSVKVDGNDETGKFYVSKDGKYLFRGELSDLTKDPLAETRAEMKTKEAPSVGPSKAAVTVVEYSDFECPVCRNLHDVMRGMLPNYPQVRLVFMDYPLDQIHPWARTAALAGRCAYNQNPAGFWKVYDLIYDNQELISAGNAWEKMNDFAGQAGLNPEVFKACLASPEATASVDASVANGKELEVQSTPTIFVNGRRIVGADPHLLEQYIKYELAHQKAGAGTK